MRTSLIVSVILFISGIFNFSVAQYPKNVSQKAIKLGIAPGISTTGINETTYSHQISINLFSSLSAGNQFLELSTLSNYTLYKTTGFQIAGISNVAGAYPQKLNPKPSAKAEKEPDITFKGIQFAGIINLTGGDMLGIQISGAGNGSKGSLNGSQLTGGINMVSGYTIGVQIGLLSNITLKSTDGFQLSVIGNYSKQLSGSQIGLINGTRQLNRLISESGTTRFRSLQIGAVNSAANQAGIQIGLVNIARDFSGYQIGLINICKKQDGIPIGPLNFSSTGGHARLYASELFLQNYEITSGSHKIQNFLTLSILPVQVKDVSRLLSYGIGKVFYKKPTNRSYRSIEVHYGKPMDGKSFLDNNLFTAKFGAGHVIHAGRFVFYPHLAITVNVEDFQANALSEHLPHVVINEKSQSRLWLGLNFGLHFH